MEYEKKHIFRKGDHKEYAKRIIRGKNSKGGLWNEWKKIHNRVKSQKGDHGLWEKNILIERGIIKNMKKEP